MLSKKLAVAAASAALMLGAFAPMAFANVTITNGGAAFVNSDTHATSGDVHVGVEDGSVVSGSNVTSGAAVASNTVGTELNNNTVVVASNTLDDGKGASINVSNCGLVDVDVETTAVSGKSHAWVEGAVVGSNVNSGAATAGSNVQSLVNVNSVTVSGNNVTE